jgi:hypothetical protein
MDRRAHSRCYGKSLSRRGAPVSEISAAALNDRRLPVFPFHGPSGGVSGPVSTCVAEGEAMLEANLGAVGCPGRGLIRKRHRPLRLSGRVLAPPQARVQVCADAILCLDREALAPMAFETGPSRPP